LEKIIVSFNLQTNWRQFVQYKMRSWPERCTEECSLDGLYGFLLAFCQYCWFRMFATWPSHFFSGLWSFILFLLVFLYLFFFGFICQCCHWYTINYWFMFFDVLGYVGVLCTSCSIHSDPSPRKTTRIHQELLERYSCKRYRVSKSTFKTNKK